MSRDSQKSLPYTLAFRIPLNFRRFLSSCNRKLSEICKDFESPEMAHMTVKFLGHSSDHLNDETIVDYLPKIHEIARKYIPISLYVRGFSTFNYEGNRNSVIFLKVLPNKKLTLFHNEICEVFSGAFDFFPHADQENFEPHITISKSLYPNIHQKIEKAVSRSRKMAKRLVKLNDLVVLSSCRMFPVVESVTLPLICPPVK